MVGKEKDLLAQEESSERSDTEIKNMDVQIREKEEILSKLIFTVKEFSAMKSEYEKLLEEIGSFFLPNFLSSISPSTSSIYLRYLERERNELEVALEKAKKGPEVAGFSTAAVDKMKERFLRVKDELNQMKSERKTKENTYKLMQRESKQVEAMQKELSRLKESRAQALKAQKQQAADFQRLKKEHQVVLPFKLFYGSIYRELFC